MTSLALVRRIVFAALLALLAWAASGVTPAMATETSERLVQEALDLRRNGDDQGAHPLLVEAYGLARSPRTAAQLGFCEQALGRFADAEGHLSEALKAASDPWIRKNREAIVQSLASVKARIARIEVVGEPTGAEISINGAVVGQLPLTTPVRVTAGEIVVELRMPGYVRASKTLQLIGGQYQKVVLRAEREAATSVGGTAPAPVSGPGPRQAGDGAGAGAAPVGGVESPADALAAPAARKAPAGRAGARTDDGNSNSNSNGGTSGLRVAAWVTGGVALLALSFGVFEVSATSERLDKFKTATADSGTRTCGTDLPDFGGPRCSDLYEDWNTARRLSIAGFVAGGVLAATSIALFVISANTSDPRAVALGCAPDVHGVGLSCVARF